MLNIRRVTLLLIAVYALVSAAHYRIWEDELTIIHWDGYGYYAYLPALFIYGQADDFAFADDHFEHYELSSNLYQIRDAPNGRRFPTYNIGLAVLWLPFFLLAHAYCLIFGGFEPDGMSWPYQAAIWLAACFYLSLGWWYLSRFLEKHLPPYAVISSLLLIGLATNLYYYGTQNLELTHLYLFGIYAAFLYHFQQYTEGDRSWVRLVIPGLLAGLMILIRSSEIVVFLLAAAWAWNWRWSTCWRNGKAALVLVAIAAPVFALQLMYYRYSLGVWWVNGYEGHFFEWPPHLYECLVGYRSGWLVYTPLAFFMLLGIGLLFKVGSKWAWSILAFTIINCLILFSWHVWTYGSTFGSRPVVQSYAVLALPLGVLIHWLWQQLNSIGRTGRASTGESLEKTSSPTSYAKWPARILKLFICTSAGGLIALNLFQTWQFGQRIIPLDLNNKTHYWHNFLATELDRHDYRFLYTDEKLPKHALYDWQLLGSADSTVLLPGHGQDHQEYFTLYQQRIDSTAARALSGSWTRTRLDYTYLQDPENWQYEPLLVFEVTRPDSEPLRWTGINLKNVTNNLSRDTLEVDMRLPTLQAGDHWQIYHWNTSADSLLLYNAQVKVLR
ncbi:MAG: hypothetical protein AAGF87_05235 [Bacteroidota bacterium]